MYSREEAIERIISSYGVYYNVTRFEDKDVPLIALCEFFQQNEKYMLSKKANLWKTECEEFFFLFNVPHLTLEEFEKWSAYARDEGLKRINVTPDHMTSNVVCAFICDSADKDALKALKKCRYHKNFRFSLNGWMDLITVCYIADGTIIEANGMGRLTRKNWEAVLLKK